MSYRTAVRIFRTSVAFQGSEQWCRSLAKSWSRCRWDGECEHVIDLPESELDIPHAYHYRLVSRLVALGIDESATRCVLLHAAGIANGNQVYALAGPSGMGKTTAVATLCRSDYGYVSDELVAIAQDGTVDPFPKPLSLLGDHDNIVKRQIGPDEAGLLTCGADLELAGVVLLDRVGAIDEPVIEVVPYEAAITSLLAYTCGLPQLERPLQRLSDIAKRGCWRIRYAEVAQLADALNHLPREHFEAWQPIELNSTGLAGWVQEPLADAIKGESRALVLNGCQPVTLTGAAIDLFELAAGGITLEEALDYWWPGGATPSQRLAVEEAFADLASVGLVRQITDFQTEPGRSASILAHRPS